MAGEIELEVQSIHGREADKAEEVVIDLSLLSSMEEKLVSIYRTKSSPFTICRVPENIRKCDHAAYDPRIVSIGPFHRGRKNLQAMEEHKWRCLHEVLGFGGRRNNLEKFLKKMKQNETQARNCYSENIQLSSNEFVEMMVLDGCFIILLILQQMGLALSDVLTFGNEWMETVIYIELLLLENQLPFLVLECLWELIGRPKYELRNGALTSFEHLFPELELKIPEEHVFHHLLHLLHSSLKPDRGVLRSPGSHGAVGSQRRAPIRAPSLGVRRLSQPDPPPRKPQEEVPGSVDFHNQTLPVSGSVDSQTVLRSNDPLGDRAISWFPQSVFVTFPVKKKSSWTDFAQTTSASGKLSLIRLCQNIGKTLRFLCPAYLINTCDRFLTPSQQSPRWDTIPSATELQEAGVRFQLKQASSQLKQARSFFEVRFEQGLMKMSRLSIYDGTNIIFRNFIALEQCFSLGNHFTSYCCFIDYLVNTPRDVSILKKADIIRTGLGSDEEVALFLNKLCKDIVWAVDGSYVHDLFQQVNQHTQNRWPRWRAKLVRDYFSNPWAIISLIAAVIILILTFLQTYFSAF